ncbi:MAG: hypothetical protein CMI02_00350 [Oceanospirillaceae bacterium]|nr:hypothetical protein [Oceanospirillaceae bacterium]MBT10468.1 hypothetical protein [Oceanospirillaceae bacterium]
MDAKKLRYRALTLLFCLSLLPAVHAETVAFVSQSLVPSVQKLASLTEQQTGLDIRLYTIPQAAEAEQADAVVLIGSAALEQWPSESPVPAVAVFVSHQAAAAHPQLASAIYLEPPLRRQIRLARSILGAERPVGVLVDDRQLWKQAGLKARPLVTPYFIDQYPSMNHALLDLLKHSDALIGIYDTGLYSSANIKNILITAYRQNIPLIGPSSAYIKAGALATTHSDLSDVARRLGEVLLTGLKEKLWPEPGYNPYFGVYYNEQVGHSLNLVLPDAEQLSEELAAQEKQR